MSGAVASTLTRGSLPRGGNLRYVLDASATTTVTLPARYADDLTERDYISVLWGEDWNSAEDAVYDHE